MATFTAVSTGSDMIQFFPWVDDGLAFTIDSITVLGGGSSAEVVNTAAQFLVLYSGGGISLEANATTPLNGTYTSMELFINGNSMGTLSGFTAQQFVHITAELNAGADAYSMLDGNDTLNGGAGNDTLFGGYGGSDTFNGNGGNDTYIVTTRSIANTPTNVFNGSTGFDAIDVIGAPGETILDLSQSSFTSIDRITIYGGLEAGLAHTQFGGGQISSTVVLDQFGGGAALTISMNPTGGTFDMSGFTGSLSQLRVNGSGITDDVFGSVLNETMVGSGGEDHLRGGGGVDTLRGGNDNDHLEGGTGNDTLFGEAGDDILDGGADNDFAMYVFAVTGVTVNLNIAGLQIISATEGNDTLIDIENVEGGAGHDTITGNGVANILAGNEGDDLLVGGGGDDILVGGGGADTFDVDSINDLVQDGAAEGEGDTVRSGNLSLDLANYANIENLQLTGSLALNLTGNGAGNFLTGNDGANMIDGGGGNDIMQGGAGSDTYHVDSALDQVFELSGGGAADTVRSGNVNLDLANYVDVENLVLTGTAALNLTGSAGANILRGNDGNNRIAGAGGTDTLQGGGGNDTFVYDGSGSITISDFGTAYFTATMSGANEVPSNLSTATGNGTLTINLGRTRAEIAISTTGIDWDGAQTPGSNLDDVVGFHIHEAPAGANGLIIENVETDPDTVVNAATGVMTSLWTSSGDGLTPALATTLFAGGLYFNIHTTQFPGGAIRGQILNPTGNDDKVDVTALNMGEFATLQTIMADVGTSAIANRRFNGVNTQLTLQNVNEAHLTAAHFAFQTAAIAQTLNGTNNVDDIFGAGGNDTLNGLDGNDRLFGEADNDRLNGGLGNDVLYGGQGNDTYAVDSVSDVIVETSLTGSGTDTVQTGIALTGLAANVENLQLLGAAAITGTGNALANTINGSTNAAANQLRGLGGNDTYILGAGDTVSETVAGSTGIDTVISAFTHTLGTNVEKLTLTGSAVVHGTGNALANVIFGNGVTNILSGLDGADQMNGAAGNDVIFGGLGNDILTGGTGLDAFVFNTAPNTTTNRDQITDFVAADDTIRLENAIFTALGAATGTLAAALFKANATGTATDADDRIIYNTATGSLIYDINGNLAGGVTHFAVLTTKPTISAADFLVI